MSAIVSAVKLHLNQRHATFVVPLIITATVAVFSILISLIFWRAGSVPGSEEWIAGGRSNPGMVYALVGFLVYLGVASVGSTFPFALTLGLTRRAFIVGTVIWYMLTAAYLAVVFAVLSAIEIATNHWFVGFYIFDVHVLGAGDPLQLLTTVFLGTFAAMSVGSVFAAGWVRFGSKGPQLIAVGIVLALGIVLLALVPQAETIVAAFELWWLAVFAAVVIMMSAMGAWRLLRLATVR